MSGRTVGLVQVFATAPDRDGVSWRIELRDHGEVRVYRLSGRSVAQTPLRRPADVPALGAWLVERRLDVTDLEEICARSYTRATTRVCVGGIEAVAALIYR